MTPAQELQTKIRHEVRLRAELRGLFGAIVRDYREALRRGQMPNARARAGDSLRRLLENHYRSVASDFRWMTQSRLPRGLRLSDEENASLSVRLLEVFEARSEKQATRISDTTQAQMQSMPNDAARAIRAETGSDGTAEDRSSLAVARLATALAARAKAIATYETQWSAETTKILEVEALMQADGAIDVKSVAELSTAVKIWRSQGDSRVRTGLFNHLAADGQRVPVSEPFTVSGESLMWPGDTSYGASVGNVINCRCSAIYEADSIEELRRILGRPATENPAAFDFPRTHSDIVVEVELDVTTGIGLDLSNEN